MFKRSKIMSKEKTENKEEAKKAAKPKIFFTKDDRIEVTVTGFYDGNDGTLQFVLPEKVEEDEPNFTKVFHVFKFSAVTYDSLCAYRQGCMVKYTDDAGKVQGLIDEVKLNKYLWTFHLMDWNFEDEKGKIALIHEPDGTLSSESFKKLYSIPSAILDKAMQVYRRKASIE